MKNYSLVKKLGSFFGSGTFVVGLFSSLGSECAFANGDFLKSKLFSCLCSTVTEEDIKSYDVDAFWVEQEKDASKNVERLKDKSFWTLVKLWKFADNNTDGNIQKNKLRRKLALKFKEDVEKILIEKTGDFKDIAADMTDTVSVLKANKYEDLFFDKNNIFVKENFSKYSPVVKEIYNCCCEKIFEDKKLSKIKVMFRFVKVCELIKNILGDSTFIKKLNSVDLHRGCVNISFFSADLVLSFFCTPEDMVKVFSIFSKALPNFQALKDSLKEMEGYLAKEKFPEFIKAYQEGARSVYKEETKKTTADVLNEAFRKQVNNLSGIFSDKESLEGLLNFKYGDIFSNVEMFSSNDEGGFFTAHVGK